MNVDSLIHGDCLEVMKDIPDKSIDMILCDLPYGTTSSKWDSIIPFDKLWQEYTRIIKNNRAICLFGAEPFSSALRMSNPTWFKYDWVWIKNNGVGYFNANLKPLNKHEIISVFSNGKTANGNKNNMLYNPQGLIHCGKFIEKHSNKKGKDGTYWRPSNEKSYIRELTNYPTTVLNFAKDPKPVHPTQKPVALCEYLIKTYSNEGDVVLDNCCGSGTTAVACINTNRKYVCIEKTEHYFEIAKNRIETAKQQVKLPLGDEDGN